MPRPIKTPGPNYSEAGRKKKIEGIVIVGMTIGVDGIPRDIEIERGIGYGLDQEAVKAAGKWRFSPAETDGKAVRVRIKAEADFHLY